MTTIDKAVTVLYAVGEHAPRAQFVDIEAATGIPKPTLYRMLRNLQENGLVAQDPSGAYRIGPRVFVQAARAFKGVDDDVRAVMVQLGAEVGLAVHVSAFRAQQLVYVDKLEADTSFYMRSAIGRLQALHSSAIGKSILARLPPERARRILGSQPLQAFTPRTITDVDEILAGAEAIRRLGYAIDDEEDELSTRAIGAAFGLDDLNPTGGISIVAPTFQTSMSELERCSPQLLNAAAALQRLIPPAAPAAGTLSA